ncbi:MAG: UvrB/UvrC motif-containing protein [Verrucomicrobiota bacterium]|jgi:hypothetical protein
MNFDISHLLDDWEYEPGQIVVRKFKTDSGVEKIQLRVDLGLLQLNATGRPDGKRPYGRETLLHYHESRLRRHLKLNSGNDDGFELSANDCAKLHQEAVQFHHRYICLFQLQDYPSVIRDTERNLKAFEFIKQFAASNEFLWPMQHLVPQLLMLQTRAHGMMAVEKEDYVSAIRTVEEGIETLRDFYRQHGQADHIEQSGELHSLHNFLEDIQSTRPLTRREKLQKALEEAVRREDYERAAQVRDQLKNLNTP